jgi:hypothetical protein
MSAKTRRPTTIEQVGTLAMQLGSRHLADYGATTSRHDFTQRQLMACLILRAYTKTTYRGVLPMSLVMDWGPNNDKCQAQSLMAKAQTVAMPDTLYADAEWIHAQCREEWGPESVIKPAVHRADGKRNGIWRSGMSKNYLKKMEYGRRWAVETFFSGLKRTMGSMLTSRQPGQLLKEAAFRVLAYTLRRQGTINLVNVFNRAKPDLVVLFPEGTSSDGRSVLPFKSALLAPAARETHPLAAGFIQYELENGDVGEEVCYWKDMTLFPHLINLLSNRRVRSSVRFAQLQEGSPNRKELARQLHAEVLRMKGSPVF